MTSALQNLKLASRATLNEDDQEFPVQDVPLTALRVGPRLREGGVREAHVAMLAELEGRWPPILVRRSDHRIIDGVHRYHAALSLSHKAIACTFFDGGEEEILLEFMRRNLLHGLPLTLAERRAVAGRMLRAFPSWSDRRIAHACGLAPGTVARVRRELEPLNGVVRLPTRVGLDGRRRPVSMNDRRSEIAAVVAANPTASLRRLATMTGCAPGTVRSIRGRVGASAPGDPSGDVRAAEVPRVGSEAVAPVEWGAFSDWFAQTSIDAGWAGWVDEPPLSRIYELADEARRRAAHWISFARALEARAHLHARIDAPRLTTRRSVTLRSPEPLPKRVHLAKLLSCTAIDVDARQAASFLQ